MRAMDDREFDAGPFHPLLGDAKHPFRRIEQGDVVALFGERDRHDPGPAAGVQHASGRRGSVSRRRSSTRRSRIRPRVVP